MGNVFGGAPEVVIPDAGLNEAEKLKEEERKKAIDRQRRGMDSTIKTSYNGVLDTKSMNFNRKELLGE